jgi:hypothetical protein
MASNSSTGREGGSEDDCDAERELGRGMGLAARASSGASPAAVSASSSKERQQQCSSAATPDVKMKFTEYMRYVRSRVIPFESFLGVRDCANGVSFDFFHQQCVNLKNLGERALTFHCLNSVLVSVA